MLLLCQFCNKTCSNPGSLAAHTKHCKASPTCVAKKRPDNAGAKKGCIPWNKGLSSLEDNRICSGSRHPNYGRDMSWMRHSEETKLKLKKIAEDNGLGGYVRGSGRGKKGWYKGVFCDSSWELAYVMYCIDHDIRIQRNTEYRTYIFNGKTKKYLPDFNVEGKIIEIKGYKTDEWLAKYEANRDIIVLYKEEIGPYIDYAISVYGKDYISLYEDRKMPGLAP